MHKKHISKLLLSPSVITLFLWMIVPLSMTLYFSFIRFNLLYPERTGFTGFDNYEFFLTDSAFMPAVANTFILVGSVLAITVVFGLAIAMLINTPFKGRGVARVLLIAPFFIMPTVNALIWKNMFFNPVYGLFAFISSSLGLEPIDWLAQFPLFSVVIMVSWQWIPFALLIFMTALQSQDKEQKEVAMMDGASPLQQFIYITLPHLFRAIVIVVMIQTIFHLSIFAEIFVTTSGGPGTESTNTTFLIFSQALLNFDAGVASAGGIIAVILANIVAIFLIKAIGKSLTN
jgi:sorbitol/mannitol transport system permease protein